MARNDPKIAPADLIRRDFHEKTRAINLRAPWAIEELTLIYTVVSHARTGHGAFEGARFPNTTFQDAARALRLSTNQLFAEQQNLITEIKQFAERVIAGKRPDRAFDETGEPLLGFLPFRFLPIDPIGVLQGLYLGGLRDHPEVRDRADQIYGCKIGSGKTYFVNRERLAESGLDGKELATGEWQQKLPEFRANGLIAETPEAAGDDAAPMFVRHRKGGGASDDTAIVAAGKLYGLSAAIGMYLSDVIDTFEKGLPSYSDQDYKLARLIEDEFDELGLTRDDAYKVTYLSAAVPGDPRAVDSSLRHFLTIDRRWDLCPIECHLLYVQNLPRPTLRLNSSGVPSEEFYAYVEERIASLSR